MSVERSSKDLANPLNKESIKNVIRFIINRHYDLNNDDQYSLFLNISEIKLTKQEFFNIRTEVRQSIKAKYDHANVKMEYHVSQNMNDIHLNTLGSLQQQFNYYMQRWNEEKNRPFPNDILLKTFTNLILDTADLLAKFNLGTPVIAYIQTKFKLLETRNKVVSINDLSDLNKYSKLPNSSTSNNDSADSGINTGQNAGDIRLSGSNETERLQSGNTDISKTGYKRQEGTDKAGPTDAVF